VNEIRLLSDSNVVVLANEFFIKCAKNGILPQWVIDNHKTRFRAPL